MDPTEVKKELRKSLIALRSSLSREDVITKSETIFQNWKAFFLPYSEKIKYLHLFLSMHERNEIDTNFFRDYIEANFPGIRVVVPVVEPVSDSLKHVWVSPDVELIKSRFGVPEPKMQVQLVSPMSLDMVLIPMLGFDANGQRIGYGKGHYDKFLAQTKKECIKVGLCFDICKLENSLPVEEHDFPLDFIVTEEKIYQY